jgi:toxin ParE1/3/4
LTTHYVLTAAAEADLRDIIRYTRSEWGDAQARSYVAKLTRGIERIAAGQGTSKDMAALYPGLRMVRCEHHYVFCLPRDDAPALVVAIFHERMDLMTRLADRLEGGEQ